MYVVIQIGNSLLHFQLIANESDFVYPLVNGARCSDLPTHVVYMMLLVMILSGLVVLTYVPLPGAIAGRLCAEKETHMKQLLLVFGMSPHAFWYKNNVLDVLIVQFNSFSSDNFSVFSAK